LPAEDGLVIPACVEDVQDAYPAAFDPISDDHAPAMRESPYSRVKIIARLSSEREHSEIATEQANLADQLGCRSAVLGGDELGYRFQIARRLRSKDNAVLHVAG